MGAAVTDRDKDFEESVMLPPRPLAAQKGRGAVTNLQGRYEVHARERFDDGWVHADDEDDTPAPFRTEVTDEFARTILSRNSSPDIPFNVSLNSLFPSRTIVVSIGLDRRSPLRSKLDHPSASDMILCCILD